MIDLLTHPTEATVADFLRAWHGTPPPDAGGANEEIPEVVPEPLRACYRAARHLPQIDPPKLQLPPPPRRDDEGRAVL
jgi:hypothetical protein